MLCYEISLTLAPCVGFQLFYLQSTPSKKLHHFCPKLVVVLIQEIMDLDKYREIFKYKCSHIISCCLTDLLCCAEYLIGDSSSIVINSEDWKWVLGLGIVGAVPMVVVALLEEGVVSGLKQHRGAIKETYTDLLFNVLQNKTET